MRHPTRKRGFGAYYMVVVLVLMALGAASLSGLRSLRSTARTAKRSASEEMRQAAEQYMALGLGLVQRWANKDEGPILPPSDERLFQVFREQLVTAETGIDFDVRLADHVGGPLAELVSRRYALADGLAAVHIEPGKTFGRYGYHGGASLTVTVKVVDQGDQEPRLPFLYLKNTYRWTVTAPTVPPPFDAYVLVVQDPRPLIGEHWTATVNQWTTGMYTLSDSFVQKRGLLGTMASSLAGPGVPPSLAALAPAVEALREQLTARRPDKALIPTVSTTPFSDGQVLVAAASLADSGIDLDKLNLAHKVLEITRRLDDLRDPLAQADQALEDATEATLAAQDPGPLQAAVAQWIQVQEERWAAQREGLVAHLDFLAQGVEPRQASAFTRPGAPPVSYWEQFDVAFWRKQAHYKVVGTPEKGVDQALRELAARVSPINGVIFVDNSASQPDASPLVLTEDTHGLTGRFVLAVAGQVRLEDFRPHQDDERSRALVLSGGDMVIAGTCEAAVFPHGSLSFEAGGTLRGALYMSEVRDFDAFARGRLERLPDDSGGEGRFRAKGAAGFRAHHMLVTVDPVASKKEWLE